MRRSVSVMLLTGYALVLLWLTLSPHAHHPLPPASRLQLRPLCTVKGFIERGGWPMVLNLAGNVVAFVPLGLLWPQVARGRTTAARVGLLAAGVSLAIESAQFISARRIADIDDVWLNALGGLAGYGLFLVLHASARRLACALRLAGQVAADGG